jgi:predicted Zn-dependent protease
MTRLTARIVLLAFVLAPLPAAAGKPDALLDSMQKELKRNMSELTLADYPKPYFLSYLMRDSVGSSIIARFGAPIATGEEENRWVYVDMRVGSPELDNTQDPYPGFDMPYSYNPVGNRAPLTDDDEALRKTLWLLSDREYKKAVASYLKVKGQRVYQPDDPDFTGSFSAAPVLERQDQPAAFIKDMKGYEETVLAMSAHLSAVPFLTDSSVSFDANRQDRYFVSSEGTRFYTSETFYSYQVNIQTRGEDGSVVPHAMVLYAREARSLPGKKELMERLDTLVREADALRKAPVMPPYSGPALLEGDTAGVFLHEALGHRLEGHRQGGDEEGATFRGKVGDSIMPDFVSVVDDPGLSAFEGLGVNGHYTIDDEGVAAQKVSLVTGGKLDGFLLTRKPAEGFKASNGHARSSGMQRPVARMGTLVLASSATSTREDLKKQLVALARSQGKPYAIILRKASSGATNTSSWGFQAFKGVASLVYRVDAQTGEETLVRDVELVGTPLASLMKIVAVGNDPALFNGFCGAESGYVPVSTITPSMLLSELEFQKSPPKREQKEILPPPAR